MKILSTITDPVFHQKQYSSIDRFFLSLIRDERDLPFIYTTIKFTAVIVPMAVLLYLPVTPQWMWWILALFYVWFNNATKSRFGLMMHCSSHRPLFRSEFRPLNYYIPWFLALFYGQSPGTYYSHHIGMHHPENNLKEDISSTMTYQRDSLRHFVKYWATFFFLGLIQLSAYHIRKHRKGLFLRALIGEVIFFSGIVFLCFINWQATLVVFIIPFLIARIVMMVGNWVQHAFVSAEEPGNEFKNSITCVNTPFNHSCWNDGYHASHHESATRHWTEHPENFLKNVQQYSKNQAIVFDGIDYGKVFFRLMSKRYDLLAQDFVNLDNQFSSEEEVIELMKKRTRRIPA